MATLDWSDCPLVEIVPGKVSGAPLLKNTRLPVEAITGNYDAFRDEGLSPDAAIAETYSALHPRIGRKCPGLRFGICGSRRRVCKNSAFFWKA